MTVKKRRGRPATGKNTCIINLTASYQFRDLLLTKNNDNTSIQKMIMSLLEAVYLDGKQPVLLSNELYNYIKYDADKQKLKPDELINNVLSQIYL